MTLLKLGLTSILLALGMVLLPPLTGAGVASLVTRSWLVLGLLVFCGNYLYYLKEGEQDAKQKEATELMAHHRSAEIRERSLARR